MTESIIAKRLSGIPPCRCVLVGKPMLKLRHEADDIPDRFQVYTGQVRIGAIYKTSGNQWFWGSMASRTALVRSTASSARSRRPRRGDVHKLPDKDASPRNSATSLRREAGPVHSRSACTRRGRQN
jgi:hypothetical protein